MPLILSIETATTVCSVALSADGKVIAAKEINEGFSHAGKLTLFIEEVMREAGRTLKELSAVAVSSGPGSYTGLRIGVSTAKGLCYALGIPLIAIPTLKALAYGAVRQSGKSALYCPMIDARRMEVYSALYDANLHEISPVEAIVVTEDYYKDKKESIICFGDGSSKCASVLPDDRFSFLQCLPSAINMAGIAESMYRAGHFENTGLFEPFYLKNFVPGRKNP